MSEVKRLNEKRLRLLEEQKEIVKLSKDAGNVTLTKDEREKYDRIEKDWAALTEAYNDAINLEKKEAEAAKTVQIEKKLEEFDFNDEDQYKKAKTKAFGKYIREGLSALDSTEKSLMGSMVRLKGTNPQSTSAALGGYTIPEGFSMELIKAMNEISDIRNYAKVITTASGNPMDVSGYDDTSNSGALHTENNGEAVLDVAFDNRTLNSYTYTSKIIKVSLELMQDSAFDLEAHIGEIAADRLGRAVNAAYTTGTGSSQPQGVTVGATEASQVASGSGTVNVSTFINLKHSVDPHYRKSKSFAFMFNDDVLRRAKLLTIASGDDRPLWQASRQVGEPDTIDGSPYIINQDMPDFGTNTNKWLVAGDFSKFWIRDVQGIQMFRYDELYMAGLTIGFQAWLRTDSRVVDTNALKYVYDPAT